MKTKTTILVIVCLAVAAYFAFGEAGNGKPSTETRALPAFTKIDCSGAGDIVVAQGQGSVAVVTLDSNLIKDYETVVKDGTLYLRFKKNVRVTSFKTLKIEITTPSLERMALSGACDVSIKRGFGGKRFELDASGASELEAWLEYDEIRIGSSGSFDAKLSGAADRLSFDVSGAADVDSAALEADVVRVDASGACELTVRAAVELAVDASGAANIRYYGDPKLTKDVSGAADVERLGN